METLGSGIILLLYRGCPLSEVKLYWHGSVGTIELVLYREVKCIEPLSHCTVCVLSSKYNSCTDCFAYRTLIIW